MCNTYKPKHKRYEIKITYKNERIETLQNKDKTNYNNMVKEYGIAKANYINNKEVVSIDFVGITHDNKTNVLWTKENNIKSNEERFIDNNLDKDCRITTRELIDRFNLLIAQKKYYQEIINICEKHRDTLSHMILASENKKFQTEEERQEFKAYIFDEQYKNEKKRRYAKNNLADLNSMFGTLSIEEIRDTLQGWCRERKQYTETPEEFKKKAEKIITYRDDKERIKYMKQYQNKFDKVKNDKKEHILYFYNHVGMGKKH